MQTGILKPPAAHLCSMQPISCPLSLSLGLAVCLAQSKGVASPLPLLQQHWLVHFWRGHGGAAEQVCRHDAACGWLCGGFCPPCTGALCCMHRTLNSMQKSPPLGCHLSSLCPRRLSCSKLAGCPPDVTTCSALNCCSAQSVPNAHSSWHNARSLPSLVSRFACCCCSHVQKFGLQASPAPCCPAVT